jgi:hypothetical protein
MNIELDTIDIYCIYTKLKIVDDFEAVSIPILEAELKIVKTYSSSVSQSPNNKLSPIDNKKHPSSVDQRIGECMFNF